MKDMLQFPENSWRGVKVFVTEMLWVFNPKPESRSALRVMARMMFMTKRNCPEFDFPPCKKREMAGNLGISEPTMNKTVEVLKELGVIANALSPEGAVCRYRFVLNPRMLWYGSLAERRKAIRKYGKMFPRRDF